MNNERDIKKNKISVMLLRDNFSRDLLSPNAERVEIELGGGIELYAGHSVRNKPKFIENFFLQNEINGIYSASARALLIVKDVSGNQDMAVAFGIGRSLLGTLEIEPDFGIRTAMNAIDPDNVKNISKVTLDTNPANSQFQRSLTTNSSEFGIDADYDLAKKIAGKVKEEYKNTLGETIEGGDSLILKPNCNIASIRELLEKVLEIYGKNDYEGIFPWFENSRVIKEKNLQNELDEEVLRELKPENGENSTNKVWASAPEFLDLEYISGYAIDDEDIGDTKLNLTTEDIIEKLPENFTIEDLKSERVYAIAADSGIRLKSWPAYKCIYAEISRDGQTYTLVEGKWYKLKTEFVNKIDEEYRSISRIEAEFPNFDPNIHTNENDYNLTLASTLHGECLDAKIVYYGGSRNKVEICDVLTGDSLIHCKMYGQSSTLSHLFQQGLVSGTLFKSDKRFEPEAIRQLYDRYGIDIASLDREKVIYCIISSKTENFEIPFFSKISICHAKRNLEAFGYDVCLKLVKQEE